MEFLHDILGMLPFEFCSFNFMQNALIGILFLAPLFALPGCVVVDSHMAYFSDAIGHAALTGVAIGVIAGTGNPFWIMILFAAFLALMLSILRKYGTAATDTLIGIIMSGATAFGIVILSRGGGFTKFSRYLIGDILSLTNQDLLMIFGGLLLFLILWSLFSNRLFLIGFNRPIASSRGQNVWLQETLFSVFIAVIVTASVQWIGVLVINSFLILPAAAARNIAKSLRSYSLTAVAIALFSGISGLIISYYTSTASGATIVLVLLAIYIITMIVRQIQCR
ncbi:MAG TPA: metal ABC transporter permease [Chitinispirillaceae bacterium]|nr:metal ABC transporter permease [Chitinispirillaceae bacterium]